MALSRKVPATMRWSVLLDHLNSYANSNAWSEDGTERCVMALLEKGASVGSKDWTNDLLEWPFPGDACFQKWCHAIDASSRDTNDYWRDHSGLFQLGRWLVSREHTLYGAPSIFRNTLDLAKYIVGLSHEDFQTFGRLHGSIDSLNKNNAWPDEWLSILVQGIAWSLGLFHLVDPQGSYRNTALSNARVRDSRWFHSNMTVVNAKGVSTIDELVCLDQRTGNAWNTKTFHCFSRRFPK